MKPKPLATRSQVSDTLHQLHLITLSSGLSLSFVMGLARVCDKFDFSSNTLMNDDKGVLWFWNEISELINMARAWDRKKSKSPKGIKPMTSWTLGRHPIQWSMKTHKEQGHLTEFMWQASCINCAPISFITSVQKTTCACSLNCWLCQKLQLIHDTLCFQNPSIRLIYYKSPQSAQSLRPNLSIQKPIHPPLFSHWTQPCVIPK